MNDDLRAHINRATDALAALEITATHLNAAAKEAIDADTALRTAKAMMDDCESALLLEAVRLGVLDGKNAETRDAQLREYRNQSIDWDGVTSAHHDATVNAARPVRRRTAPQPSILSPRRPCAFTWPSWGCWGGRCEG